MFQKSFFLSAVVIGAVLHLHQTAGDTLSSDLSLPRKPVCPTFVCLDTNPVCQPDEERVVGTFELNGITCFHCPECQPKQVEECPLARCLLIRIPCVPGFEFTERAFENVNGEICLECPECLPECEIKQCPDNHCPLENVILTTEVQNGRVCPGCPSCSLNSPDN